MEKRSSNRPPPAHADSNLHLIHLLRSTLAKLEQSSTVDPADPAMAHVRGSIARSIAELEILHTDSRKVA